MGRTMDGGVQPSGGAELTDVCYPDGQGSSLVAFGEVDLGADPPVVDAGRVVEDLPYQPTPRAGVDEQHRGTARVRAGADAVMLGEVGIESLGPRLGVPARIGIQFAKFVVASQRGERDPPEQRIAYQ